MAYQLKYYFDFYRQSTTEKHTIQIEQDTTDTLTAEEITGADHPFTVEMPDLDSKFQVVRGKGCTLNLLSDTDGKFFKGLYHVNPTEIRVKHLINDVLRGLYYLDSEMMQEPYDVNKNYPVSVTGSDGLALMDRFSFIQLDGTNYTGVKSKYELLQIIIGKIGLPWSKIYISLATTFTGYSGAVNKTILHESYVDCANFYDEDDKPMTLREVVESILAPYGAHFLSQGGYLYITDVHTLTGESITFKGFNIATWAYDADMTFSHNVQIDADTYRGTGAIKEQSGGKNRQVVSYSPYPLKSLLDKTLTYVDEFTTVPDEFDVKDGYYYRELEDNTFWEIDPAHTVILNPVTFEQSKQFSTSEEQEPYLRVPNYEGLDSVVATLIVNPFMTVTGPAVGVIDRRTAHLSITGEMLFKLKDNPYDEAEELGYGISGSAYIFMVVKIGDKYLNSAVGNMWVDEYTVIPIGIQGENINDKFVKWSPQIKYIRDVSLCGNLEIEIHSKMEVYSPVTGGINPPQLKEVWIKNIAVSFVDYYGNEFGDDDVEYIGLLDPMYRDEGDTVTLTCGTDSQYTDRGKIMKSDGSIYSDILTWTRAGQTFKIEELLLNSLCSNNRTGYITLSNMKLKADFTPLNVFLIEGYVEPEPFEITTEMIYDRAVELGFTETYEVYMIEFASYVEYETDTEAGYAMAQSGWNMTSAYMGTYEQYMEGFENFAITVEMTYARALQIGYSGTIYDFINDLSMWDGSNGDVLESNYAFHSAEGYTGTYEDYLALFDFPVPDNRKLMVKSLNIDYWDNVMECTLVEISPDELIIEK